MRIASAAGPSSSRSSLKSPRSGMNTRASTQRVRQRAHNRCEASSPAGSSSRAMRRRATPGGGVNAVRLAAPSVAAALRSGQAVRSESAVSMTDSAIALFERLTGRLFTRSRNSQDRSWSASKTQAGRLIRLFGGAIDAMVRAREHERAPFDVLDEEIGWDRLVASREEIAALGDLATQVPLSLATQRYVQLRRYAPAFLEAFEFDAPASGQGLHSAVTFLKELNRTGKRKLPDIVPMPFPSKHCRAAILDNGTPQRRIYETAVVATLRDRLRAGDVWVEGSRGYRRFDAYLVPTDEAQRVLGDSALETDAATWLEGPAREAPRPACARCARSWPPVASKASVSRPAASRSRPTTPSPRPRANALTVRSTRSCRASGSPTCCGM